MVLCGFTTKEADFIINYDIKYRMGQDRGVEEALKLNLAIAECIRRLDSYKRSTKSGRSAGLNLAIHLEAGRVTVNEERLSGE